MISATKLKILKKLLEDLTRDYTIREIAMALKLHYPQVHRSIKTLSDKKIINKAKKGGSSIISLNFEEFLEEYLIAEFERKKDITNKYSILKVLDRDLEKIKYNQYICILFGSYSNGTAKRHSDIDLLFVIPEDYDYEKFEKNIKNRINIPKVDIHITTEEGLIEMWNTPARLNVGNELLKKHIILRGIEAFLHLRRRYYVG